MNTTTELLGLAPFSALLILINRHYKLRLNPNQVKLQSVRPLGGKTLQVTVASVKSPTTGEQSRYEGALTVRYNRLDLAEVLGESLMLELSLPATLTDVLAYLTTSTGIVFDEEDFGAGSIWTYPQRLQAKPTSLRWVGEVAVYLKHPGDPIALVDAITTTRCNGFTPRLEGE